MEEYRDLWEEFVARHSCDPTLEKFEGLRTDLERFHFCRDLLRNDAESKRIIQGIQYELDNKKMGSHIVKSHLEAVRWKLKGDQYLADGLYKKAVEAFSESICHAPISYPTEGLPSGCSCGDEWTERPRNKRMLFSCADHPPNNISQPFSLSGFFEGCLQPGAECQLYDTEGCQQCRQNRENGEHYSYNAPSNGMCRDMCCFNGTFGQCGLESSPPSAVSNGIYSSESQLSESTEQCLDVRISLDCPVVECNRKNFYLARAIGSRAEALFQLGSFKNCLADIQECFAVGCPLNLIMKLNYYKAHCLAMLGRTEEAIEVFDEMLYKEAENDLPVEIKKTLVKRRRILSKGVIRVDQESATRIYSDGNEQTPLLAKGEHNQIANCSSLVQTKYNHSQGRFLEAGNEIKAGDVLILESPYASILLAENKRSHCNNCFKSLLSPYPCRYCDQRYCSQECREAAWTVSHSRECALSPLLDIVDTFGHLSLRILLVTDPKEIINVISPKSLDEASSSLPGFSSCGKYEGDYESIHSLVTNAELQPPRTLMLYTLSAALLAEFVCDKVRQPSPSGDCISAEQFPDDTIGCLLLHHLQQMACNVHAVTAIVTAEDEDHRGVVNREQKRIATAVYPTASLLNHSCDPDVIVSFVNNKLVLRATHNIRQGEEITHCYGPHVSRMTREARQRLLREQYFFTCKCVSCRSDEEQENQLLCFSAFACPKCRSPLKPNREFAMSKRCSGIYGVCLGKNCNFEKDLVEWIEQARQADILFRKAFTFLQNDELQQGVLILKECLKIRKSILHQHHKDLAETHDALARCYAETGDFRQAAVYCTLSTNAVEKMFSSESIEYAHELYKLSQLLFNGQQVKKCMEIIKKAIPLLSIHYGEDYPEVVELFQMRTCLIEVLKRRT